MVILIIILIILSIQLDCVEFKIVKNREWSKDSIFESNDGSLKISVKPLQQNHNYLLQHSYKQNFTTPNIHTNFNTKLIDFKSKPSRLSLHSHDKNYFESWFSHSPPEIVFHKFNCYRYQGFQEYVETLPGFEKFILSLDDELHTKGLLKDRMIQNTNWEKSEEVLRYLNNKYHQIVHRQYIRQLNEFGFDNNAIALIDIDDFIYPTSGAQYNQLQKIGSHTNELANFSYQDNFPELIPITNDSTTFTLMSNNANKQNMVGTSQILLQIAEDFLSLAKGVVKSCGRNALAISEMLMDPIKAGKDIAYLIGNIGIGIGKVAETCTKFHTAININDNEMLSEASNEIDITCNQTYQLYKSIEQKYHDASRAEVLELTGALATDAALMMYAPKFQIAALTGLKDALPINEALFATEYIFQKLGNAGKRIKQVTGLACAKGKCFVSGTEAAEELELALAGRDNISMHFNQSLESTGSSVISRLPQYVKVPFSNEVKAALKQTKNEILAYEKLLQSQGKKYKDIFGIHLPEKLKNQPISFKGISHIKVPNIKETIKPSGKIKRKIVGFHWDPGKKLEKAGLYKLENYKEFAGGMYEADLHYKGVIKVDKTFFPSSWDFKKLTKKITEASNNILEIIDKSDGTIVLVGKVNDGFKLRIKLSKRGEILTIYPFIG